MAEQHDGDLDSPTQAEGQMGEMLQMDYSYTQWRQARMRQLERNYAAQWERDFPV